MFEERQLNGLEKFLDAVDLVQPINFSLMVTLDGPISLKLLSAATKLACERLPASLLIPYNRGTQKSFFSRSPFLPRIEVASSSRIERTLGHTINHRFDLNREAPIRLRWQPSETQHLLIVTFMHTSADGTSGLRWINALLESLDQLHTGKINPSPSQPLNPRLIEAISKPSKPLNENPCTKRLTGAKFAKTRSTAVLGIEFSQEETDGIFRHIQERNLSINTVLSAAHLRAVSTLFDAMPSMSLSFPVDLRRGRGLPSDAYGCFVSEARIDQRVNAKASTVALSRRLDRALKDAVSQARPWNEKIKLPLDPRKIYESRATTAVSNLGTFVPHKSEDFLIHRIGFAVGCSVLGDQVLTILTTQNRMTCMLCWTIDTAKPDQIRVIGEQFRENLLSL
jgi:hypothetical protein